MVWAGTSMNFSNITANAKVVSANISSTLRVFANPLPSNGIPESRRLLDGVRTGRSLERSNPAASRAHTRETCRCSE
jgi:hypothetical protein